MTALHSERTSPAYPLGKPLDGRLRFSMTHEQAKIYNWLVTNRPHDRPFAISFRSVALAMAAPLGCVHQRISALVDRGWLTRDDAGYRFVQPVRVFKEPSLV